MYRQLKAIVGFKEEEVVETKSAKNDDSDQSATSGAGDTSKEPDADLLKTRIDTIGLSPRTVKALTAANIRTIGGLSRKKEADILDVEGLGTKGIQEIKKVLATYSIALKQ